MLYIKNPPAVIVRNLPNNEPVTEPEMESGRAKLDAQNRPIMKPMAPWKAYDFLSRYCFGDEKIPKGEKGARAVRRLSKALRKASDNEVVSLDSADVEIIKNVLKDPAANWPQVICCQFENVYIAFEKASEKKEDVDAIVYDTDDWS